jgi:serine/threonine protein kinase
MSGGESDAPLTRLRQALEGRYRIERQIGVGGMATVYLAHDVKHDRRVALKVLKSGISAAIGAERFLQEIRVAAVLQHPHLVPLFESGEADVLLFYVMPFVDGESLRDRMQRERHFPVADAIRIAIQVSTALDYAHRRGVVHRDVKPENILLHEGQAMIADFGIALALGNAGDARITAAGTSLGTPFYMSPEQASADRTLDGRTDIYSLGIVLYEMLAGEPPFTGSSAQLVLTRVMTEPPRPVSALRPSVLSHVEDAVTRAIAKIPSDRWSSGAEFAAALERASLTGAFAAQAEVSRRPGRWVGIGLGALIAILVGFLFGWFARAGR